MLATLYMVCAAAFFVACAWAQVNDPDPEIWVATYVFCGAVLNILALHSLSAQRAAQAVVVSKKHDGDSKAAARKPASAASYSLTVLLARLSCAFLCVYLAYEWAVIAQRYGTVLPAKVDLQAVWTFLELEEGREVVGLALLLAHTALVLVFLNSSATKRSGCSTGAALLMLAFALCMAGAVYLWIYYQPLMNKRYNTPHCNGAFDSLGTQTPAANQAQEQ